MKTWYKDLQEFTENEIRNANPNTVFGYPFDPTTLGYEVVFSTPQPIVTDLQMVVRDGTEIDTLGNRVEKWLVIDKFSTQAEIDAYLLQKQTEAIATAIKHFEQMTTDFIQSKIDAYNATNGLAFTDIDAFTKYALVPTSQHNAIAIQFVAYADNIWKALRDYQSTLTAIPTDAEVQAVLDSVVF